MTISAVAVLVLSALTGCSNGGSDDMAKSTAEAEQLYPDVVAVTVSGGASGGLRFDVTISSPYDTPQRYADAWRVVGIDGTVFGVRELLHDHAGEQPFTRSLDGVEIPDGVDVVIVEARDQLNGWGGEAMEVTIPTR